MLLLLCLLLLRKRRRDRSLGANCILLNCFVTTLALHFLFHLDFPFHLILGFFSNAAWAKGDGMPNKS